MLQSVVWWYILFCSGMAGYHHQAVYIYIYIEGVALDWFAVLSSAFRPDWFVSPSCKTYIQSPYNIIDLLAILPLPLRISMGIPLPSMDENLVVHVLLVGFVPFIRLLKMVRRFHKMQLLLHVLSTTIEVLKLLLFMVSIIVLAFSIVLYIVDDPLEIDSLSTAIYMCNMVWLERGYMWHEHLWKRQTVDMFCNVLVASEEKWGW